MYGQGWHIKKQQENLIGLSIVLVHSFIRSPPSLICASGRLAPSPLLSLPFAHPRTNSKIDLSLLCKISPTCVGMVADGRMRRRSRRMRGGSKMMSLSRRRGNRGLARTRTPARRRGSAPAGGSHGNAGARGRKELVLVGMEDGGEARRRWWQAASTPHGGQGAGADAPPPAREKRKLGESARE